MSGNLTLDSVDQAIERISLAGKSARIIRRLALAQLQTAFTSQGFCDIDSIFEERIKWGKQFLRKDHNSLDILVQLCKH